MLLLKTVHGSHLYGLAHALSDLDTYEVVSNSPKKRKKYAKHTIIDGVDRTVVDLSTFRAMCDAGVPQALEALFTPVAEVDVLSAFRHFYRVNLPQTVGTYRRTIKAQDHDKFKSRRHALRLNYNLNILMQCGRFNPRLDSAVIKHIDSIASDDGKYEMWYDRVIGA